VFVIQGEIEIVLTRTEALLLGAGDCAYFGSQSAREVRNAGAGRSIMLWVSSLPPTGVPL
jgi:mannose-6-phosphate isomerase-like protein (cupin superfamily)